MHRCNGCGREIADDEQVVEVQASLYFCLDCVTINTIANLTRLDETLVPIEALTPVQLSLVT